MIFSFNETHPFLVWYLSGYYLISPNVDQVERYRTIVVDKKKQFSYTTDDNNNTYRFWFREKF